LQKQQTLSHINITISQPSNGWASWEKHNYFGNKIILASTHWWFEMDNSIETVDSISWSSSDDSWELDVQSDSDKSFCLKKLVIGDCLGPVLSAVDFLFLVDFIFLITGVLLRVSEPRIDDKIAAISCHLMRSVPDFQNTDRTTSEDEMTSESDTEIVVAVSESDDETDNWSVCTSSSDNESDAEQSSTENEYRSTW